MVSDTDHSQKSVFLYKPGNSKVQLRDAHIRERLRSTKFDENDDNLAAQRLSMFLEARDVVQKITERLSEQYLEKNLLDLSNFVKYSGSDGSGRLPTTILLKADVKSYIAKIKEVEPGWNTVSIHSKECPNIKSTLKLIVNRITERDSHVVSDRRLTYDFNVLIDWLKATSSDMSSERLLVVVEDADGFDPEIIRDLISHMHTYVFSGELKLHIMLNLSVPLPVVEENLSQDNVVAMNLQILQGLPPVTSFIDECSHALFNSASRLVLNKALTDTLFITDIIQATKYLQYAILGHFAGNPLAGINSLEQLSSKKALLLKLPSIHAKLVNDPDYLERLLSEGTSFEELPYVIPEMQVGGAVLDLAFDPNYRPLIEQALTDPRLHVPYLDKADRMSVPATVMYQLTRESSIYINIYDLYCAFKDMLRKTTYYQDWDRQCMAIFLETITSFKMIGILRDCKRKFECVEKVSWKGV